MKSKYIQRIFNLEPADYRIISRTAKSKGFGSKGHSAALRFILRDWEELKARFNNIPLVLEGRVMQPGPDPTEE